MSKLRVLLTTPNLHTAGGKYVVADLVQRLDTKRFDTTVCVQGVTDTPLERKVKARAADFMQADLRFALRNPIAAARNVGQAARQFRGRFDVAISFDYANYIAEPLVFRAARIPWIWFKTNLNWNPRHSTLRGHLASRIVCIGRTQYHELFDQPGLRDKRFYLPVGVDVERFTPQPKNPAVLRALGLPEGAPAIVCVAHLVPVKGHPDLLRAWAALRHSGARLVLIGGGTEAYTEQLRSLAAELGIADRVHFLGVRGDVPSLLPHFDGFVLATRNTGRREGFGAVLPEAMACALPVVATKSGGPEDIVAPGQTGWLVDAEGHAPLTHALDELLADLPRAAEMGTLGRERCERYFDVRTVTRHYERLFLEVAGRRSNNLG